MQAQRKARRAAMTIEGEAVVIERHAGPPRPVPRPADEPTNDNRPDPAFAFQRTEARPDLVFPGRVRWPAGAERSAEALASRIHRLAAVGTAVAGLAAVALIVAIRLSTPTPPAPLRFELTETKTTLSTRRDGPVLAVEGRIRNVSMRAGATPVVRVLVDGADGALAREFHPSRSVLRPGASLFFHSTLALPSATSGAIAVSLAQAAERKTMTR